MIKSFVMAGVILGAASSFAVGGSVTTYDQNGPPPTDLPHPHQNQKA
jgi:hypothetical protein